MTKEAGDMGAEAITIKRSYADGRSITTTIFGDMAEDVIVETPGAEGRGASILAKAPRRLTEAERALRDQRVPDLPQAFGPR